jgi:hypothetical protein
MPGYPKKEMAPGKLGIVTDILMNKNIGIDGKIYQLVDARVDRVRQDNPQLGDEVEYKISASKELLEKGKISFFAIKKRAGETLPTEAIPPEKVITQKAESETQDIQALYVGKEQAKVTLKDCAGQEQTFRADLDVIKMLAKADSPVQPGNKYRFRLVKQGEEWVVALMGSYDELFEEKPFRTGSDILKENLEQKRAEQEKADAALAQIKKEEEQATARIKENQEHIKTLTGAQKSMPTPEPTNEPEICQQNANVNVSDAIVECPVELKVHLDCGSYSNFDLTVPGLPIDQAIARVEADATKTIALMHRLMAAAKKGY